MHLLGVIFSVCRDLVALRRNPIRSIASRDPICRKTRKIDGFYRISRRRDTIEPNGENYVGNANTQPSSWHAMLSRVLCHSHPLQCLHGIAFDSNYGAGGLRPPHTPPGSIYISIASILALESQIVLFFSKSRQSCTHNSTFRCAQTL